MSRVREDFFSGMQYNVNGTLGYIKAYITIIILDYETFLETPVFSIKQNSLVGWLSIFCYNENMSLDSYITRIRDVMTRFRDYNIR